MAPIGKFKILLVLTCISCLLSCTERRQPVSSLFPWESITPASDSAILALEQGLVDCLPSDSLVPFITLLEKEAASHPHLRNRLMARTFFWKGRLARDLYPDPEEAPRFLEMALAICDSVRDRYDFMRISLLHDAYSRCDDPVSHYRSLKKYEKYFSDIGDDATLATLMIEIGHLFNNTGDADMALASYLKADSIFKKLGFEHYHRRMSLNNANVLFHTGKRDESREIIRRLLSNREIRQDSGFYANLRLTGFVVTGDTSLITEGYRDIIKMPGARITRIRYMLSLGGMYLDSGMVAQARHFTDLLSLELPDMKDARMKEYACQVIYETYEAAHMEDSAHKYLRLTWLERGKLLSKGDGTRITALEGRYRINEINQAALMKHRRDRLLAVSILLSFLLVSMVIVILIMRRAHRNKLALMETRLSLERKQRGAVSSSLAMTEKDNILQSVLHRVEDLSREDKIEPSLLRDLQNEIRMHLNGKQEWEDFQAIYEEVHPSFGVELKSRWPALSEGDIRLATYIRIGLPSKQIARMLHLQPDSVRKNRQRLRHRMGLKPQDSLEDTLRQLG